MDMFSLRPDANPNDLGRGPMIMGILWSFTALAALSVIARIYVRKKIGALYWDDWLMILALVFQLVDIGFITRAYSWGMGKHDKDLTLHQLVNALKWGWLWMIPGTFVAVLARVSSAVFLLRLFGHKAWFRWFIIIFTALQCAGGIIVLFVSFLGVRPVAALWNPFIKASRMDPKIALITAYTAQSIFTLADLTYVMVPVLIIWRLQMSLGRRIGLIFLMATSLVTMTASLMKTLTLQASSGQLKEPAYASTMATLWSGIEQTLVIIMASVPALSAASKVQSTLFSRLRSSFSSRFKSYGNSKPSSTSASRYYHDLEMKSSNVTRTALPSSYNEDHTESLVDKSKPAVGVRRTDQYTVSYGNAP